MIGLKVDVRTVDAVPSKPHGIVARGSISDVVRLRLE